MGSVREIGLKIKARSLAAMGEWGLAILVILAVVAAFGLGRLSVLMAPKPALQVQNAAAAGVGEMRPGGYFVASRTGEVYYFPWCSGAQNIPPEKQRWFNSAKDAEKAGYRPAKNCRGME